MQRLLEPAYKRIKLKPQHPKTALAIQKEFGLRPVASRVLAARGFKLGADLKNFLEPTLKEGLPDPKALKGLDAAGKLLRSCLETGGAVAVCCDFDVDGLSGGSQIHHFLTAAGAKSHVFVPDRFEDGYGLNDKMMREAAALGCKLLIAVDFGTTNSRELELAKSLGLSTIVVDHHHVRDLPLGCDAFVNPQQPGCGFAGGVLSAAGLAWYFILGVRQELKGLISDGKLPDPRAYLDLACLGTICDMVPLTGANRVIAKRGLEMLASTKRPGLVALKRVCGANGEVSCYDVSFGIGPRLNAAGRMVHGQAVIELLTTSDSDLAGRQAQRLNRLNADRQETEGIVKQNAIERLQQRYGQDGLPAGIVVWDDDFHTGVIGIVAQRLVEQFYRPSVVMGVDGSGEILKGSVRGVKGFSVIDALQAVSPTLLKFGGHEGAGGLSVERERLDEFADAFIMECSRQMSALEKTPAAEADTEALLEEIDLEMVEELKRFAPFGMGNPAPLLLIKGLRVVDLRQLKGTHLKTTLTDGSRYIAGLLWRQTSHPCLVQGAKVDIVCRPDFSTYQGVTELQANLQAVQLAGK